MPERFWITTLGCPKNDVDSEKLIGRLDAGGYERAEDPGEADLIVVNTCAFIEAAREESIETILELDGLRAAGSRLVVTGCLAERSGEELAAAIGEIDLVAGFGVPVEMKTTRRVVRAGEHALALDPTSNSFDLLELPRPPASAPWAYVKVAEGCDRRCGFCAIPSFRGKQRSRSLASILAEIERLEAREIVLVAQDLASYGHDRTADRAQSRVQDSRHRRAHRGSRATCRAGSPALPVPVLAQRSTRRGRPRDRRALLRPLPAARIRDACCARCAATGARPASSSGSGRSATSSLARPSGRRSSSATRARPRRTTTSC